MTSPDPAKHFLQWVKQGELKIRVCRDCGRPHHVPRYLCPHCGSDSLAWKNSQGRGQLVSWTVTERPLSADFTDVPMITGVVRLDEGPCVVARLELGGVLPRPALPLLHVPRDGDTHLTFTISTSTKPEGDLS